MTRSGKPPYDAAALLAKVTAALPGGGEARAGQTEMARAVARSIASGRHLAAQAGTGTGKSLAYLVPAIASGARVVVATATKALQDQLASKDLPSIASALDSSLPHRVTYAVLKGRSNYLCLQRVSEVGGRTPSMDVGAAALADDAMGVADQVRRLLAWSSQTDTGERAELSFEPHPRAWAMVSVGPNECPGATRCPQGQACFAERAHERAAGADVVVVNTHLYGAHLASDGAVLPHHDVVVFDEAHQLEDVLAQSLGVDVAPGRLSALHTSARPFLGAGNVTESDLGAAAVRLGEVLGSLAGTRVLGSHPELTPALALARTRLDRLSDTVSASARSTAISSDPTLSARSARVLSSSGRLAADLARLGAPGDDEVVWVDGTPRAPVLRLTPVDVGPLLAERLWPSITAVLTSATLPPRLTERVCLDTFGTDSLDVGSPFDFEHHALLYVARHLPDRRHDGADRAVFDELGTLVEAAGGRTLALFTSRRATEAAASALRGSLPGTLLVQGELPKGRLLETFCDDETSSLFATLGFWQGVDVPGRSLSLVAIDRLPFARPDDPVLQARRERAGEDAFALVDLPRAATLLAQGVGRLIRSASDRGVVAVLDARLATARYRGVLLDALPPMRRTVDREVALSYLRELVGGVVATSAQ